MRISDWSSDVCSSDLAVQDRQPVEHIPTGGGDVQVDGVRGHPAQFGSEVGRRDAPEADLVVDVDLGDVGRDVLDFEPVADLPRGAGVDRKSAGKGKGGSVRVDLGGGRMIANKQYCTREIWVRRQHK